MKSPIVWLPVVIAIWSASTGCRRDQEPAAAGGKRTASSTTQESTPSNAADSTDLRTPALGEDAGRWVPVGEGLPVLSYVSTFVGRTPVETGLWQSKPLAPFLFKVLGPRYETLLINMQEAEPIREENGVVYVLGHKKYSEDRAALAIDTATDGIFVWLLVAGKPEEHRWGDAAITLPTAVRNLVDEYGPTP